MMIWKRQVGSTLSHLLFLTTSASSLQLLFPKMHIDVDSVHVFDCIASKCPYQATWLFNFTNHTVTLKVFDCQLNEKYKAP